MMISVIICTIRRAELLSQLLDCLKKQTYKDFEVVVVGPENNEDLPGFVDGLAGEGLPVVYLTSGRGLSKARNAGLRRAEGDIICFFDDDVLIGEGFLAKVVELFTEKRYADVGGITGYDTINYNQCLSPRWRLRKLFGVIHTLTPGESDHLGRNVPLNLVPPTKEHRAVKWLPGFCQIFRRSAIEGLSYDEHCIAAEDRDFSMDVGNRARLLFCGDLEIEHHMDSQGRLPAVRQIWRAAYALGRSFTKRRTGPADWFRIAQIMVGELLVDIVVLAGRPNIQNLKIVFSRQSGFFSGMASLRRSA